MNKYLPILILLGVCCLGCNDAAKQMQADQARSAVISSKLKAQGEALHKAQAKPADVSAEDSLPKSPAQSE